jgi:DNA mismatch repair protein MutL
MADDLSDTNSTTELDEIKLDIISMISCKASIKAGQRLKQEEIDSLIAQLAGTRNPFTCPHGRPIIVRLDRAALEKIFHRRK